MSAYDRKGNTMVILITGATHTGKTKLAQRLLEKYKYPYLSMNHLKMGLIRSGNPVTIIDCDYEGVTGNLVCVMNV